MEKWVKVDGFPEYKISNYGRVRSCCRIVCSDKRTDQKIQERIKKTFIGKDGYEYIDLHRGGLSKKFKVHLLVLCHFGSKKPTEIHECNHKDGIKTHNFIENLEWVTSSENKRHAILLGLIDTKGIKNINVKLKDGDVFEIRKLCKNERYNQKEIGSIFGISQTQVSRINTNKRWGHI